MSTRRFVSNVSNVHRGTAFEQRSLQVLQDHFSMSLRRVGGKSDGGIDLVGWWWLPHLKSGLENRASSSGTLPDPEGLPRRRLRVLAQCKAEKRKFSPNYVREMEGVWHIQSRSLSSFSSPSPSSTSSSPSSCSLSPSSYECEDSDAYSTVALLLSESPFSQSTLLRAYKSTVPFLLIQLPPTLVSSHPLPSPIEPSPISPSLSEIGAVCPNPTLTDLVTPLVICWERNPFSSGSGTEETTSIVGRPGLWWHGRKLRSWAPDSGIMSDSEGSTMV
ncbi:hypothetical protein BU15DRAFT_87677 [Melanogaster broomeanus]|nr:hypothetical protein BU15DRAFT_87677 [Melanogaster broomeanus]